MIDTYYYEIVDEDNESDALMVAEDVEEYKYE